MGLYPGYADVSDFKAFENWIGYEMGYIIQMGSREGTGQLVSSVWGQVVKQGSVQTLKNRVDYALTIPLAFGHAKAKDSAGKAQISADLTKTINGAHDSTWKTVAKMIRDAGLGDAIIRLGHEFDGDWYPWSAQADCSKFRTAYRHVADVMRSEAPNLRFDFNGSRAWFDDWADCAYPGSTYVDIIGLDVYDQGVPNSYYDSSKKTWKDPAKVWNDHFEPHLEWHLDFAKSKGKPVSFPEWGLGEDKGSNAHGGDNPYFIEQMHAWFEGLPANGAGSLEYQAYFDGKHSHSLNIHPKAKAKFKALFS